MAEPRFLVSVIHHRPLHTGVYMEAKLLKGTAKFGYHPDTMTTIEPLALVRFVSNFRDILQERYSGYLHCSQDDLCEMIPVTALLESKLLELVKETLNRPRRTPSLHEIHRVRLAGDDAEWQSFTEGLPCEVTPNDYKVTLLAHKLHMTEALVRKAIQLILKEDEL